ncbi:indole-3-glycerol phosphate synthase TrpC [Bacillus fonticola]|uniref:indole-3-glycerol phosphate synthase TrpC n=1 Tax=Bacillus fonticola TaxID=2728853 RepID=UPI001473E0F7|nr:indole-3-glycerol phosphate synthase TrpC [Bacillus fonticola]
MTKTGTILDRILETKREEIAELPRVTPPSRVKVPHGFTKQLAIRTNLAVISEFKRASPSKGDIAPDAVAKERAWHYERSGASAISCLTDATYFKGSFDDLEEMANATHLPVLCKDFIIDKSQIDYAVVKGASLILLIVSALTEAELKALHEYASSFDADVLVEVHNEEELETAFRIGATLIGVNNRNLATFEVDLCTSEKLGPLIHNKGAFFIAESGIATSEDVARMRDVYADGLLVGESLMRQEDPSNALQSFQIEKRGRNHGNEG